MSFSADWLALRSDADRAARNPELAAELAELVDECTNLRVLDLGAGTGANMAATAPFLTAKQEWTLVDADAELLDLAVPDEGIAATRKVYDLAGNLAPLFDPAPDLVTASAFFDLCGEDWIGSLVEHAASANALVYAVLNYDGIEEWAPAHETDAAVLAAFHQDQRRDKGLGPAAGPDGAEILSQQLKAYGYSVLNGSSKWELSARSDGALIAALAEGSASAVRPRLGSTADTWLAARREAETVTIGHRDILAVPPRWSATPPD